jgi:hypothetical protein
MVPWSRTGSSIINRVPLGSFGRTRMWPR